MGRSIGHECCDIEGADADEIERWIACPEAEGAAVFIIKIRVSRDARFFHERFQLFQNPALGHGEYEFWCCGHDELSVCALNMSATRRKFLNEVFVAALEVINAVDRGFAFGNETRENKRDGSAEVCRHDFGAR